MKPSRSCVFASELLLLFAVLLPVSSRAQQGPGGLGGFSGVQNLNQTSIAVQVKIADGSKLGSMAIVNLSNALGQMVRSQSTFGSQTVFEVASGAYVVAVAVVC